MSSSARTMTPLHCTLPTVTIAGRKPASRHSSLVVALVSSCMRRKESAEKGEVEVIGRGEESVIRVNDIPRRGGMTTLHSTRHNLDNGPDERARRTLGATPPRVDV